MTFDGTSTVTTGGTAAGQAFNNVVLNGTSVTLDTNAIAIGGALTLTAGYWSLSGQDMEVTGAYSCPDGASLRIKGTETVALTMDTDSGKLVYLSPGDNVNVLTSPFTTVHDVEFNDGGGTPYTFTLGADATVNALTVTDGAFALSDKTLAVNGGMTVAANGTVTGGSNTITLADNQTVTNNGTWSSAGTGTFECSGSATFAGNCIAFYHFTSDPAGAETLTFNDDKTYTFGGTLTLTGVSGSDILNIVRSTGGTNRPKLQKDGTSSVEYVHVNGVDGVSGKTIVASSSWGENCVNWQFGTGTAAGGGSWNTAATWASGNVPGSEDDVTIAHDVTLDTDPTVNSLNVTSNTLSLFKESTAHTLAVAGSVTVGGTLDVGIGALTAVGASTITGTLTISTGTYTANDSFDASGGTVTFTGTGTLNLAGAIACGGLGTFTKFDGCWVDYKFDGDQMVSSENYHHLKLSTGGAKKLCESIDVDGNLTVNLNVTFNVEDSAYSINIAGNWLNSGTFSHANGTVTFDGTDAVQTIACGTSSPFYNLTIKNIAAEGADDIFADNLDVDGKLLLMDGDLNFGANKEHHFAGDFEIQSAGSITTGTDNTFIVFDGTTTLTDNSSGGPQNLGHVKVAPPAI
ncbi:MAG: hypothetical protein KAV83_00190 [Desulfobacterales bacterium]|nr:hypothetical protein [Desulfobacterales bacterium]